ncbi:MAG: GIY-YIG nuclease family protein [Sulfurimonas sp.]|nr:GIY-YIG nuclease family protein [Sulfurimonas sp.]
MSTKEELLKELENDPFGLLVQTPEFSTHRDEPRMVIENFMQILDFYEKHLRQPKKDAERAERSLAVRFEAIQNDKYQRDLVKELDRFGWLDDGVDVEKIKSFEDDPFGLLGSDAEDIFVLKNVTKEIEKPDYVASRKVCKDFKKYEELFKSCHVDLANKVRSLQEYRGERFIKKGVFFVLKGVVGYVASVGKMKRQNKKTNARLHCIFENATESDMLLRSLSAELYKDGKIINALNEEIEEALNQVGDKDILSGYIYVLKSKSEDEIIRNIENLYKIGYSTTKVNERIKNAKNEPTYLMADVEEITSFKCYNLNPQKLEQLLHQFFSSSCLNIQIVGNDGSFHMPREWFIAPFEVIQKVITLIGNEEIVHYKYDEQSQRIVQR